MKVVAYRKRSLLLALVLGLAGWQLFEQAARAPAVAANPDLDAASARIYYRLDQRYQVGIELQPNDDLLRISTIACWPASRLPMPDQWRYQVEARLLDTSGAVRWSQTVTLQTRKTRLADADGTWYEPAFADDADWVLADPRWFSIAVAGLAPEATRLQLCLPGWQPPAAESTADGIGDELVLARVFRRRPLEQSEPLAEWQTLSALQQEHLARVSCFSPAMLSDDEREQLVIERWRGAPLAGVPDRDFVAKRIFRTPRDRLEALVEPAPLPTRTWIDPRRAVAWDLPAERRWRLLAWPRETATDTTIEARAQRWTDSGKPLANDALAAELGSGGPQELLSGRSGEAEVLQLAAAAGSAVVVIETQGLIGDGDWQPLAPATPGGVWHGIGPWPVGVDDSVDPADGEAVFAIPVTHLQEPVWHRLDIRPVAPAGDPVVTVTGDRRVTARWQHADGRPGAALSIDCQATADPLAWTPAGGCRRLGAIVRRHLQLPPEAARLVFQADGPVALRLFSRPPSLPIEVADRFADAEESSGDEQRDDLQAWHLIEPVACSARRLFIRRCRTQADDWPSGPRNDLRQLQSLQPALGSRRQELLWPVRGLDERERGFTWTPRTYCQVAPGERLRVEPAGLARLHPGLPELAQVLGHPQPRSLWPATTRRRSWILGRDDAQVVLPRDGPWWLRQAAAEPVAINLLPKPLNLAERSWWRRLTGAWATPTTPLRFPVQLDGRTPLHIGLSLAALGETLDADPEAGVAIRLRPVDDSGPAAEFRVLERLTESFRWLPLIGEPLAGPAPQLLPGARPPAGLKGRLGPVNSVGLTCWPDLPAGVYELVVQPRGVAGVVVRAIQQDQQGQPLPAGGSVAWDLCGPGRVHLRWRRLAADSPGPQPAWWNAQGRQSVATSAVDPELVQAQSPGWQLQALELPPGPGCLRLSQAAGRVAVDCIIAADSLVAGDRLLLRPWVDQRWRVLSPARSQWHRYRLPPGGALAAPVAAGATLTWRLQRVLPTNGTPMPPSEAWLLQCTGDGRLLTRQRYQLDAPSDPDLQTLDGAALSAVWDARLAPDIADGWQLCLLPTDTGGELLVAAGPAEAEAIRQLRILRPADLRQQAVSWRPASEPPAPPSELQVLQAVTLDQRALERAGRAPSVGPPAQGRSPSQLPSHAPIGSPPRPTGPIDPRRQTVSPRRLPTAAPWPVVAAEPFFDPATARSATRRDCWADRGVFGPEDLTAGDAAQPSRNLPPLLHAGERNLLLPAEPRQEEDPAAAEHRLHRVTSGEPVTVLVPASEHRWRLLVLQQDTELAALRIRVRVDGGDWWQEMVPSRSALMLLPSPPAGAHQVQIDVDGGAPRLLMNLLQSVARLSAHVPPTTRKSGDLAEVRTAPPPANAPGPGDPLTEAAVPSDQTEAWRIGTAFERPRDPACRWRIPRAGYADGRLLIACYHADPERLGGRRSIRMRARLRDAAGNLLAERLLIALLPPSSASDQRITDLSGRPVLPLGVVAIPVPASFDDGAATLTLALPSGDPILLRLTDQRPRFGTDQHYRLRRRYSEIDE